MSGINVRGLGEYESKLRDRAALAVLPILTDQSITLRDSTWQIATRDAYILADAFLEARGTDK